MSARKLVSSIGVITVLLVASNTTVRAVDHPVTYWNGVASAAAAAGRNGPTSVLDIAIVQLAVHDAVQAIEREYAPYKFSDPSATGSPQAAVAAASYAVLASLYPAQRPGPTGLDQTYANYVSSNGLAGNPGLAVGAAAAAAMLLEYRPVVQMPANTGSTDIGQWRPTPPANMPLQMEYLATTKPFALLDPSQFRPHPPPPLTSVPYARDYIEVKSKGSLTGADRTALETDMAHFWTDNYPIQWNRALRGIVDAGVPDIGESARLFALANLAVADTIMTVWDSKVHFNFWRPITAIREGDNDPSDATEGDPAWTPLLVTPPYPDYSSGANGLTGAYTTMLQLFFGTDDHDFVVTSVAPLAQQKTRQFERFSQAADEVVEARILLGIHFRFADEEARQQGSRVAHWVFQKFLKPLPGGNTK
jgi:hypothetical protein